MFRSFFLGGFECATGINSRMESIDQVAATHHDRFLEDDYVRLKRVGIRTVREGLRWPNVEKCVSGRTSYDFRHLSQILKAARKYGVEVIFDLFHYGYPPAVDIFGYNFAERFSEYCYAAAKFVCTNSDGPYYFTPLNEPSFFSWAAGEVGLFAPHAIGRGYELKKQLVGAAIQGTNAIWQANPNAEIIMIDPICHVVAASPEYQADADGFNNSVVYQSLDMISGRLHPELGGSPKHLGTIGINYYWNNQWVLGAGTLDEDDPRRIPFRDLVRAVYDRYRTNLLISETSHIGDRRADWLTYCADEVLHLIEDGIPVHGICLYPILGMPEWHDQERWSRMGLWDLYPDRDGALERHLHIPLLEALIEAQCRVNRVTQRLISSPVVEPLD